MSFFLKLTGAALIIFCGTSIGFIRSKRYSGRVSDIEWYISAFQTIMQKIRFGMPDTAQTVSGVSGSEKYYEVSRPFKVKLRKSYLEKQEEDIINEYFCSLGQSDLQTEYERAQRYIAELEAHLRTADEKKKENSRLCKLLGVFSGVAIAVILI